jgi:hypothetical protein
MQRAGAEGLAKVLAKRHKRHYVADVSETEYATMPTLPAKVTVTFELREDGGLRVYSKDVPGFVLSHSDAEAVVRDVVPALERILSHVHGRPIELRELVGGIPPQREYAAFAA